MKPLIAAIVLLFVVDAAPATEWVRAGVNTNVPVWGVRGGLLWAIPPGELRGRGGPRGLLRVGYPVLTNGGYDLVNFIAVEPIVNGRRGFSELEPSQTDQRQGKLFWAVTDAVGTNRNDLVPGRVTRLPTGAEQLAVTVRVEPFANDAKVRLVITQRSDAPDEIKLTLHADPDSAPLDKCILTATMGNLIRARQLWLKDEVVNSLALYARHRGDGFAPHAVYAPDRLPRVEGRDVLVAITTDEADPAAAFPFPGTRRWYYGGLPVTQYWRKPAAAVGPDLRAVVNARYTYWQTQRSIPGGVSFENFELNERFHEGQEFIFGITRRTPAQLGIAAQPPATPSPIPD
jgi:hypothetical protein